ncbi:MAG: leucine-rich repeat protein [Bacteroidaceae bacterium]|nr:leucine-rich repeat protein [Bacteroidaceae bacterium]
MERRFFSCIDKIGINNYLTIIPLEDGLQAKLSDNECEYCIDGNGYWKVLPAGEFTETVNAGHTLSFRGNLTPKADIGVGTFAVNKYFNLKGNCLSLLYGDNAKGKQTLQNFAFKQLFAGCDKLLNAKEMVLSVKSIGYESCHSMFRDCKNLITAPKLPAKVLSGYSYYRMFYGCSSLITAPELPAMTLELACYRDMFYGCTSLITAPELPETTLASSCYNSMFYNCTSLTSAPKLPATVLTSSCYSNMFNGCTSLRTAPELPATILSNSCYSNMFIGCTSLITAPELPATVLTELCYYQMFGGCSKLNYIKMLATDISANSCLSYWMYGVAANGTFIKSKDATWDIRGASGIPNGWEIITE